MLSDANGIRLPFENEEQSEEGTPILYATDLVDRLAGEDGKAVRKQIQTRLEQLRENLAIHRRSGLSPSQYGDATTLQHAVRTAEEFMAWYRPLVRHNRVNI